MLPPRRGRRSLRRSAAGAKPYCWKAPKDRRRIKKRRKVRGDLTASLSDDALAGIFAGLPDAAAVVRCAATCRRWGRVVATSAAIVSRSLPPLGRFLPDLAVGIFHRRGIDLPVVESPLPCFVPMASAARFLGDGQQRLLRVAGLGDDGGLLGHSRPVASRNGRLVLELRRRGGGLRFAVCNPMMRDNSSNSIVLVPPLKMTMISTEEEEGSMQQEYGCALLTGQDLRPPRCNSFFRLLLVYNNHHHCNEDEGNSTTTTVVRCYSSDTGCWGREAECSVEIPSSKIRDMGHAVVRRGVALWALDLGVLGAWTDEHGAVTDTHLVPYGWPYPWPENRLLGISPDNRLFFMHVGVLGGTPMIMMAKLRYFRFEEEDDIRTNTNGISFTEYGEDEEHVWMPQMKVSHGKTAIKLRWFGEKSGLVLFTMGRPSGHKGSFVLNLHDKVVTKVAYAGDSWENLLGYEMDMAAYLALPPSSIDHRSSYLS